MTMAQQNVAIERGAALFQASGRDAWLVLLETTRRLHIVAQVNAALHANLTRARQYLADTRQRFAHMTTGEPRP
jgi:hypothetical protein